MNSAEKFLASVAKAMPERELQQNVSDLCDRLGALHYHTHDSRRSDPGFPDSIIMPQRRLIVAELKRESKHPTAEQISWLDAFRNVECPKCRTCVAEVYVWRPSDWLSGKIEDVVRGSRR